MQFKLLESDLNDTIKVESHLANLVRYGLMSPEVFAKETGRPNIFRNIKKVYIICSCKSV